MTYIRGTILTSERRRYNKIVYKNDMVEEKIIYTNTVVGLKVIINR